MRPPPKLIFAARAFGRLGFTIGSFNDGILHSPTIRSRVSPLFCITADRPNWAMTGDGENERRLGPFCLLTRQRQPVLPHLEALQPVQEAHPSTGGGAFAMMAARTSPIEMPTTGTSRSTATGSAMTGLRTGRPATPPV
jgi:hypothetical protein